ncbi:MAG: lysylphosphatidylglycerol synthase transmembrane domain-containing protein [Candidatus Bathyarchaeia archaeon]
MESLLAKRRFGPVLFYCVGLGLYAALIRFTGVEAFWSVLRRLSTILLLQILAIDLCFYVVKTIRWKVILGVSGVEVGFSDALAATLMGYMASMSLPIRMGELYRCYALKRLNPHATISKALSSVVVEGFLDAVVIIGLLAFSLTAMKANRAIPIIMLVPLMLGVVIASIRVSKAWGVGLKTFRRVLQAAPASLRKRIEAFISSFMEGLSLPFSSVKVCCVLFGLSTCAWTISLTYSWIILEQLGFHLGPVRLIAGMMAFQLSLTAPSPPGYVGSFEAYWSAIYAALGLGFLEALRLGVSYHFFSVLGSFALGGLGLLISRLAPTLKRVREGSTFKEGLNPTPLTSGSPTPPSGKPLACHLYI